MATNIPVKKRRVRGELFYVVDSRGKIQNGKRNFFRDKKDAENFAESVEVEIVKKDPPLILSGKEKRDYLTAKDILGGRYSMTESAQICIKSSGILSPKKFEDGIELCVSAKGNARKDGEYLKILKGRLTDLQKACEREHCHEVTQSDIEDWINSKTWQAVTKKGALIDVNTFFNFAKKKSWVNVNPCQHIEPIAVEQYARGILTPKQAEIYIRTIAKEEPKLVRYFADQLFGGLRELEARNLTKSHEHKLHIELPGDDVYEPGFIEWNPTWLAWRKKYPGEYYPIHSLNHRLDKIKATAKKKMIEEKAVEKDWWFPRNCLRHSFCSYGAKLWGTGRAAELARHSEAMQKKHYRRPIPMEDAKAFWAILP